MAHQSPPPSVASRHPTPPPNPDSGDKAAGSSSNPLVDPNPELNRYFPLPSRNPAIYSLSFDQDYNYFAAGLDSGAAVYIVDPFKLKVRHRFSKSPGDGGIQIVSMLFRHEYRYLCVVGGGPAPMFPRNTVYIFDGGPEPEHRELMFDSEVRSVKFREDCIVVVLDRKIHLFTHEELIPTQEIDTCANPRGLCAISHTDSPMVLACPHDQEGQVLVYLYGEDDDEEAIGYLLSANDSPIACMAMTPDGRLLAFTTEEGSQIWIFNTSHGQLHQEVMSGYESAEIYSLAFSPEARWLAVSSDKGTVQVFIIKIESAPSAPKPDDSDSLDISSLSLCEELTIAQFRIPEGLQHLVGFGFQENTVVIIGMDGSFYRCKFDPAAIGGVMTQLEHHHFMELLMP